MIVKNHHLLFLQYGFLEIFLKFFYSDDVEQVENAINTVLQFVEKNPADFNIIFNKFREFKCISRLMDLCNHPIEDVSFPANILFDIIISD